MNFTPEHVLQILEAADLTRSTEIKGYALSLIVMHFGKVNQPRVYYREQKSRHTYGIPLKDMTFLEDCTETNPSYFRISPI